MHVWKFQKFRENDLCTRFGLVWFHEKLDVHRIEMFDMTASVRSAGAMYDRTCFAKIP